MFRVIEQYGNRLVAENMQVVRAEKNSIIWHSYKLNTFVQISTTMTALIIEMHKIMK